LVLTLARDTTDRARTALGQMGWRVITRPLVAQRPWRPDRIYAEWDWDKLEQFHRRNAGVIITSGTGLHFLRDLLASPQWPEKAKRILTAWSSALAKGHTACAAGGGSSARRLRDLGWNVVVPSISETIGTASDLPYRLSQRPELAPPGSPWWYPRSASAAGDSLVQRLLELKLDVLDTPFYELTPDLDAARYLIADLTGYFLTPGWVVLGTPSAVISLQTAALTFQLPPPATWFASPWRVATIGAATTDAWRQVSGRAPDMMADSDALIPLGEMLRDITNAAPTP